MAKIKAVDGATLRVNGVGYPIPKGTEFNIAKGNSSGLAATDSEIDGDGTSTTIFSRIRGHFSGLVVRLKEESLEDSFNDLFGEDEHLITVENGDSIYTIESGALISPQENGTPEINHVKRTTEAFTINSDNGFVIKRTMA